VSRAIISRGASLGAPAWSGIGNEFDAADNVTCPQTLNDDGTKVPIRFDVDDVDS